MAGVPQHGGGGNAFTDWFYNMPPVSRGILVVQLGFTCLTEYGFLGASILALDVNAVWERFEIWRLATTFLFIGGFSYPFMLQLYCTAQYGQRYEFSPFNSGAGGSSADHAWFLILSASMLLVTLGIGFGEPFLGLALFFTILYVWTRRNPDETVSIMGLKLAAPTFLWALLAIMWALEQDPTGVISKMIVPNPSVHGLVGIIVGHIFYFAQDVYPKKSGTALIRTPIFLKNFFGVSELRPPPGRATAASAGTAAARLSGGAHSWGSGRVLESS